MNGNTMKMALYALKGHYQSADNVERIIIDCALVAAAADGLGSLIPGLSVISLIVGCFGAVWVMYGKICKELNISLKENVLKLLARAALTNIAANLGGALMAFVASLLIPGASILAGAVVTFITVYLAGLMFVLLLNKLAEQSNDLDSFSDVSPREIGDIMKKTTVTKEDLNAAKDAYEANMT